MGLSTNNVLDGKRAGSQFELTDFEKIGLKEAKPTNHTRPKLTAKAPLQRNLERAVNRQPGFRPEDS